MQRKYNSGSFRGRAGRPTLCGMEDALITERRPIPGPQVYGYLRHVTGSPARHTALTDCLVEYCGQHELTFGGVFTERETHATVRSAAFVGLLDTLGLPDTYGAVVPARNHLGSRQIAAEREAQIAATDTRLIVIRPTAPQAGAQPARTNPTRSPRKDAGHRHGSDQDHVSLHPPGTGTT